MSQVGCVAGIKDRAELSGATEKTDQLRGAASPGPVTNHSSPQVRLIRLVRLTLHQNTYRSLIFTFDQARTQAEMVRM